MVARLQAIVFFALALPAAAWLWWSLSDGDAAGAVGSLCAVAGSYLLVMAAEFALMRLTQAQPPPLSRVVAAWWHEVLIAPQVFLWRQPFRSAAIPDDVPPDAKGRIGVILVHGFLCNRGLWNPWMHALQTRGTPFLAVNLEPVFGSIDQYTDVIDQAVRSLRATTDRPVVLVGHSMGGIAIRKWWSKSAADADVRRVLTIGTPHRGTWLARFGYSINGRQLRQASPWLESLAATESASRLEKFTCYFSDCDNIVFPSSNAALPGAENVLVPGQGHMQLAFSPVVFAGLMRWLD